MSINFCFDFYGVFNFKRAIRSFNHAFVTYLTARFCIEGCGVKDDNARLAYKKLCLGRIVFK